MNMDSDDVLLSFQQEWRRELENSTTRREPSTNQFAVKPNSSQSGSSVSQNASSSRENRNGIRSEIEIKAAELFNEGVQLEQNGQLYESIKFYRRAISMVPDIEFRVHQKNMQERDEAQCLSSLDQCDENHDELEKFYSKDLVARLESFFSINQPICEPQFPQEAAHLSCLPTEMLDKILSWVVGNDLDLESLEKLASVCRGFFLICRKPDIWRRACVSVWGINTGELISYESWREMFIWRPRPRFNGCYISKTTYFRSGEASFQDQTYQPWHLVCYYRYLRFFPKGHVLMLTSSEEPQAILGHLKTQDTKYPQVLIGHFRIHGNSLTMLFRKASGNVSNNRKRGHRKGQGTTDIAGTTFQMELEIKAVRERPHWHLVWKCYSIVSSYQTGTHATSVVDVSDQNSFPPLVYSKVRSYCLEAEAPLP